jgi:hypothetical protein
MTSPHLATCFSPSMGLPVMSARLLLLAALLCSSSVLAQIAEPAPPPPAEEGVVAVLELTASKGAEAKATAVAAMLTAEVAALPGWRALSRNELRSILSHASDAQLAGCADVTCSGDVGRLLSAQRVLTGEVTQLEGAVALSLTLVDTSDGEARIAARQEAVWRGPDDELLLLARPLVHRLFDAEHASQHVGSIEVFTVDGAAVFVDGKEVGTAPFATPLRDIATGVHTVRAVKSGYRPLDLDIVVARNEATLARVELVEESLFDQPWFWAAAGGVVLVAGGAAAGITTWAVINQPEPTRVSLGKP